MGLDIRLPLGLMFLIVGALMTGYGFFTRGSEIYLKADGTNINLIWGVVMLAFGLTMYLLGRTPRAGKLPPQNVQPVEALQGPAGIDVLTFANVSFAWFLAIWTLMWNLEFRFWAQCYAWKPADQLYGIFLRLWLGVCVAVALYHLFVVVRGAHLTSSDIFKTMGLGVLISALVFILAHLMARIRGVDLSID